MLFYSLTFLTENTNILLNCNFIMKLTSIFAQCIPLSIRKIRYVKKNKNLNIFPLISVGVTT